MVSSSIRRAAGVRVSRAAAALVFACACGAGFVQAPAAQAQLPAVGDLSSDDVVVHDAETGFTYSYMSNEKLLAILGSVLGVAFLAAMLGVLGGGGGSSASGGAGGGAGTGGTGTGGGSGAAGGGTGNSGTHGTGTGGAGGGSGTGGGGTGTGAGTGTSGQPGSGSGVWSPDGSRWISVDPGQRIPLSVRERMLSMRFPAVCEQNAGRMVRGRLERAALNDYPGGVTILTTNPRSVFQGDNARLSSRQLADQIRGYVIDADGDGVNEYVVAAQCWRGGVDWPEMLFLVDQDLSVRTTGRSSISGWKPAKLVRAPFTSFTATDRGTVRLTFASPAPRDPDCCPSMRTSGEYRFIGNELVPVAHEHTW